jgi:hypothetical protein
MAATAQTAEDSIRKKMIAIKLYRLGLILPVATLLYIVRHMCRIRKENKEWAVGTGLPASFSPELLQAAPKIQ